MAVELEALGQQLELLQKAALFCRAIGTQQGAVPMAGGAVQLPVAGSHSVALRRNPLGCTTGGTRDRAPHRNERTIARVAWIRLGLCSDPRCAVGGVEAVQVQLYVAIELVRDQRVSRLSRSTAKGTYISRGTHSGIEEIQQIRRSLPRHGDVRVLTSAHDSGGQLKSAADDHDAYRTITQKGSVGRWATRFNDEVRLSSAYPTARRADTPVARSYPNGRRD